MRILLGHKMRKQDLISQACFKVFRHWLVLSERRLCKSIMNRYVHFIMFRSYETLVVELLSHEDIFVIISGVCTQTKRANLSNGTHTQ